MRIELSIKATYLPRWSAYEGVRELVQNGRDAEVELSAPLTVRHRKDSSTLVIENDGCTIPHEALLLGHSTKADRSDLIGQWGEGLKLGILALVRAGHAVKIRSGDEVWVPAIERSDRFNADVLVFDIAKREPKNRVQIEVSGISADDWQTFRRAFLFLDKQLGAHVKTDNGTLLLDERHSGRVYVKGILVSTAPVLTQGYDLIEASLDRDRRMIESYDLDWRVARIWRDAVATRPDLVGAFGDLLAAEAADVAGFDSYRAAQLPNGVKTVLAAAFTARHGADAIPVSSLADSADVAHLGKVGVVAPKALRAVLEQTLGTVDQNKAKLATETVRVYGWHELTGVEQTNVLGALALIGGVEPVTLADVEVADFRSEALRGLYKDGRAILSKAIVADRNQTLATLVHEVAHRSGGDGEKAHVASIERIWSGIVAGLRGGS
jgi:hypothetical protein